MYFKMFEISIYESRPMRSSFKTWPFLDMTACIFHELCLQLAWQPVFHQIEHGLLLFLGSFAGKRTSFNLSILISCFERTLDGPLTSAKRSSTTHEVCSLSQVHFHFTFDTLTNGIPFMRYSFVSRFCVYMYNFSIDLPTPTVHTNVDDQSSAQIPPM